MGQARKLKVAKQRSSNQAVGNAGLFYVSYLLSRAGWNVLPTSRNARGIDALIYSSKGKRTESLQVKCLSKRAPVPLGTKQDSLFSNWFVICVLGQDIPRCFLMKTDLVRERAHMSSAAKSSRGIAAYWLQPNRYEEFEDGELVGIGSGLDG